MELVRYEASLRQAWDETVRSARNGHFQFLRSYMDYHSDRFEDASYLARDKGRWLAVVPGHRQGEDTWASHRGLSYGGIVLSPETGTPEALEIFRNLNRELSGRGFSRCLWRPVPWIYHKEPSEELLYLLHRQGAALLARNLSTAIDVQGHGRFQRLRRRRARAAREAGVQCRSTEDLEAFWPLVETRLETKYGLHPVHTLEEIALLRDRNPDPIRLYGAFLDERMLAGCLVFQDGPVFHLQYLHSSDEGRELGAPDLLVEWMLEEPASTYRWLHFGHSCEQGGKVLNAPLLFFKEGFGGRAVVLDEWECDPRRDAFADA